MDLIERLEAATDGSAELDEAVALTAFADRRIVWGRGDVENTVAEAVAHAEKHGTPIAWILTGIFGARPHPRYTTSLDSALTLVPEGWEWACGFSRFVPHYAKVHSSVAAHGHFLGEHDHSRALALCIAALKARAG